MNESWQDDENREQNSEKEIEKILVDFSKLFEKCKKISYLEEDENKKNKNEEELDFAKISRNAELLNIENEEVLLFQRILELSLDNPDKFNWERDQYTKHNSKDEDILYYEFVLNLGIVNIKLRHYSVEKGEENKVKPKNFLEDTDDEPTMDNRRDVYQVFIDNSLTENIGKKNRKIRVSNKPGLKPQKNIRLPKVTINVLPSTVTWGTFDKILDDKPHQEGQKFEKKRFRTHSLDFLSEEDRHELNRKILILFEILEEREDDEDDEEDGDNNSDWWKK